MAEQKMDTICRVCLDTKESKCFSIFETFNGCSITEKIHSITNIKIKEGDGLPDKICPECLIELETATTFKQKCEASNKILWCNIVHAKQQIIKFSPQSITEELEKVIPNKEEIPIKEEFVEIDFKHNVDDSDVEYMDAEEISDETLEEVNVDAIMPERKSRAIDLKLICDDCGGTFKSKCKLRVHWKKVHQPEKLICPNCKRAFKSFKPFNLHMRKKSRSCNIASKVCVEGQGKSRVFHCRECSYKSRRIKDVDMHMAIHTGDRRFQCQDCSKSFTQLSSLHCHRETTHKDFKVDTTCHLCGKHIQGRCKFYKHMKTHNQKSVQCKVCNKVLKSNKYLSLHMLRHSGTKSYSCEICAASFFTYYEVYNHRAKVHMKTKNIKCDQCDYKMHTMAVLKKHKAKHTGTNVVCMICGQFSENAEKLAIHQKRHFDRNVQCTQCEKMFHNKRSLSKHMSKHHRCTMLFQKRQQDDSTIVSTAVKQESPPENNLRVILASPQTIILS